MDQTNIPDIPRVYPELQAKSDEIGFTMPSDVYVGTLLKTLISSKPSGNFLELGTGIGLSLAWMLEGMDRDSKLISLDNDKELIRIATDFFGAEERLELLHANAEDWLLSYWGKPFDLIFADAWPGKYSNLEETLGLLKKGGFYVIDDMKHQPNWPQGHENYVLKLVEELQSREDLTITKMDWSTGVLVAVKLK